MTDIEKALSFHRNGQLQEAQKIYSELLKNSPDDSNVLNLFGVLKMQQAKFDEAVDFLLKAMELNPSPVYADNLGLVYYLKQDYTNALKYYELAVAKEPYKDSIEKIVDCYKKLGNYTGAIKYLKILYDNDKNNLTLIREIAQLADTSGDYKTAEAFYKNSLKLDSGDYIAENNLGLIYEKQSNLQQAKNCYLLSLKIKNNFEAHKNLGVLYRKEKDYRKSEEHLNKALIFKPGDTQTHLSLGMTYLVQKKFYEGYKHYILKNPEIKKQYKNSWDGKIHKDAKILIFCDGGFGDYIMFSRYITKLQEFFSGIIILTPPELELLFKKNFSYADIKVSKEDLDYDFSASVMDLPYLLGLDFSKTPAAGGYLSADFENKFDLFQTDKTKIGLFWHGNQRVHKNRSIPFDIIQKILDKDVMFYSFQKDEEQKREHRNLKNLAPFISNFYDTACAMKNLDLMITIDSASAHLAGALGVKTFLMLPGIAEWRWFSDSDTTLWYNSINIYRQTVNGQWEDVIDKVSKNF